jgi:alanine-synthesizing transaminase
VVRDPRTHRYSASRGIPGLRRAQANYYARRFGVKLNPDTQIVATLGSKEGFANMAQAITAPGDVILCPNPTYPIHAFGFIMAGGVIRSLQVEPTMDFIPALLERAVRHSIPKPIAIVNYPSNPTAMVADLDFYKDVVAFARSTTSLILSDLAYSESISTAIRRRRCCRCRARWTSRSNSPRCRRPSRCPAGAWALRSATSG